RPLREYRGRIVVVDVIRHPVEVEVADVADDLTLPGRQNRFNLHRLPAQVEVRLEVGDQRVVAEHREALRTGHRVRRDVEALGRIDAAERDEVAAVLRLFALRIEPEADFRSAGDRFAYRVNVLIPRNFLAGDEQLAGAGTIEVVALADRPLHQERTAGHLIIGALLRAAAART